MQIKCCKIMTECRICRDPVVHAFNAVALKKYPFEALICAKCGLLQIANPHWLKEAYGDAIAEADTGLVMRNIGLAQQITPLLYHIFQTNGSYVDYAGGTGLFVRLMRDAGFDFLWHDPYCENIHARGFEYTAHTMKTNAVTAFEVLEHVLDPISLIRDSMQDANADLFICTTQLFGGAPPDPKTWWYYAFNAGQHISFYQYKTLKKISELLGLHFFSNGTIHLFYTAPYLKKIGSYFNYKIVRKIAARNALHHLKSKTMEDHLRIIENMKGAPMTSTYKTTSVPR